MRHVWSRLFAATWYHVQPCHAQRGCPHLLCYMQLALSHDQRAEDGAHASRENRAVKVQG